jgi:hypothetical protein
MDIITELLNLEDADITVSDIRIEGTKKILTLDTALYAHYCPCCGFRMYSRGVRKRKMIDRLVHHGHLILFEGNSYRMEHALMKQTARQPQKKEAQNDVK